MGSNDYYTDEGPAHKVTITRDYYLDETEVTNAEYEHVMGKSPSPKGFDGPDQPVVLVSWKDADAYCRAINKRLPTEAEWENAATVGGTYSFGSRSGEEEILEEEVCFKKGRQKGETCNVKDYPPNELGLYGMSGNVWEWVSDWHDFYPLGHVVDPKGPQAGEHKMLRGVSYCYINSWDLRATKRSADNPNNYSRDAGFRCAW
jgi:formylglycine-generating enzyme required for sulfatase activity